MKKKIFLFIVIALAVLVAGVAVFLQLQQKKATQAQGGSLYVNPAQEIPNTNPFQTKTNPYQGGYKNPFSK